MALVAASCSSVVAAPDGPGGGGGCPAGAHCTAECPSSTPMDGSSCDAAGRTCIFHEFSDCAKSDAIAVCNGSTWTITHDYEGCCEDPCSCDGICGEPCPDVAPKNGDVCDPDADLEMCSYLLTTACGAQQATATCIGATWNVVALPCNAGSPCAMYTDPQSCDIDPACRWLSPGCDQVQIPEGCYPAEDCVADACPAGETCTGFSADTCSDIDCNICSKVFLCTQAP